MDLEQLVRCAAQGDVKAFVALTQRFQHFAFGSALALVGDFHPGRGRGPGILRGGLGRAAKPRRPRRLPGWLRSIVRHQASRVLRRAAPEEGSPTEAEQVASEQPPVDDQLDRRRYANAALAAIADLPANLREAATLFFVHDCSHQDIARLPRHFRNDREQPPARGPHQIEREDADHGDEDPPRASPARRFRQPHRPAGRNARRCGRSPVRSERSLPGIWADRTRGQRRGEQTRRHHPGDPAPGRRHRRGITVSPIDSVPRGAGRC